MRGRITPGEPLRLLRRLGLQRETGDLQLVEERGAEHRVGLRRGHAVALELAGRFAPLGEVLRREGLIDDAQLRRSLAHLARGERLQGRILVSMGILTNQALEAALRRQAELRLERLLDLRDGHWRFEPGPPSSPAAARTTPIDLGAWSPAPAERRRERAAGAPPGRVPDRSSAARALLGVPIDADGAAVRRAYHRLALALHPDRHPDAPPEADYALRFATVHGAYRALV